MADLPPMARCPANKRGRHAISAILPESSELDMTLFCIHCGALRRVGATGTLYAARLDDLPAAAIRRLVNDGG